MPTRRYTPGQPILSLNDPFLTKTGTAATLRPSNLLHIRPDTKDGDVWKWNFDIQRELFSNMALTVAYVGSKGSHLGNSVGSFNQAPPIIQYQHSSPPSVPESSTIPLCRSGAFRRWGIFAISTAMETRSTTACR